MNTWLALPTLLVLNALVTAEEDGHAPLPLPKFERIVIDDDFPGGYQVEIADIDGDGRPDIVALGGGTCAWYENPTWRKRVITGPEITPGIISSAATDLDGDSRAEVAIAFDFAMNEPDRGKLGLAIQGDTSDDMWIFKPIADLTSIHRVRWADMLGDGRPELVVAPIFGRDATPPEFEVPARLGYFRTGEEPIRDDWTYIHLGPQLPIIHAIEVRTDLDAETLYGLADHEKFAPNTLRSIVLTADSKNGVTAIGLGGNRRLLADELEEGSTPLASSEVHVGLFDKPKRMRFVATIEPWHGNQVIVRSESVTADRDGILFDERTVLDDTLDDGHALWVSDINGDGYDEVFAGHRGEDHRISVYRYNGNAWDRTVLDRSVAAQDLRGGDLTGNGLPDVVAIGGSTRNIVWYRPQTDAPPVSTIQSNDEPE